MKNEELSDGCGVDGVDGERLILWCLRGVDDRMTDWQTDERTDIGVCRVAFETEKVGNCYNAEISVSVLR